MECLYYKYLQYHVMASEYKSSILISF